MDLAKCGATGRWLPAREPGAVWFCPLGRSPSLWWATDRYGGRQGQSLWWVKGGEPGGAVHVEVLEAGAMVTPWTSWWSPLRCPRPQWAG